MISHRMALLLVGLSLSIGWGIRGNFGHEAGAMIPGALSALAVCLCSGREDWLRRVPFFAMFGALGWAFGGSIAYMPTLGYTHSGHLPTQIYGFFSVFVVGFLWTALGAAGVALAAAVDLETLGALFRPLLWIFAAWSLVPLLGRGSDLRHQDPLYWLDSEWLEAITALAALALCDLWDRRFARLHWLAALTAGGAALGYAMQQGFGGAFAVLVTWQGDVANWPSLFVDLGPALGPLLGAVAGAAVYFTRWGVWRGAELLVAMTTGSLVVFLIGPVLLTNLFREAGGFRLQPPRGDSWANILGAFLGFAFWCRRHRQTEILRAAVHAGMLGGLGFMTVQTIKILALAPGNPVLTSDPSIIAAWAHYRSANWHSLVAEQGAGFVYGLALAFALARLAARTPELEAEPAPHAWIRVFAVVFVLNIVVYLNAVKNVAEWVKVHAVPPTLRAPLIGWIELSALNWFHIVFVLASAATIGLLFVHVRRGVALVPATWTGKGQLLFLVFLGVMVFVNFERALPRFHESRLITEGLITCNAVLAIVLLLGGPPRLAPRPGPWPPVAPRALLAAVCAVIFALGVHAIYGDRHDGWGGRNLRFGPEADWITRPLLKDVPHR